MTDDEIIACLNGPRDAASPPPASAPPSHKKTPTRAERRMAAKAEARRLFFAIAPQVPGESRQVVRAVARKIAADAA